jgi:hypothetical protein
VLQILSLKVYDLKVNELFNIETTFDENTKPTFKIYFHFIGIISDFSLLQLLASNENQNWDVGRIIV